MISFENVPPDEMEALCTPMHRVLSPSPPDELSASTGNKNDGQAGSGALYLGSMAALGEHDLLRSNHIAHLVQVLEVPWAPQEAAVPPDMDIAKYRIDLEDSKSAGPALRGQLAPACDYIRDALGKGENVLVHCHQVRR